MLEPGLSLYSIGKSSLFIKDYAGEKYNPHGTTVEISRWINNKDNRRTMLLECSIDTAIDCRHVQYALCLPEVALLYGEEKDKEEVSIVQPIPIDLTANQNEISLREFYAEKKPSNDNDFLKILVFVYYITKFNKQSEAKYGEILSCYKEIGQKTEYRIDDTIKNCIKFTGWLEQGSDKFATRLTTSGENFVEFKLPPPPQQKHNEASKSLEDAPFMVEKVEGE